jgi:Fe-S-cluster-containing dehydrogenase component
MTTSAEQIHHGKLNLHAERTGGARLCVDLNICERSECKECVIKCSYFYHPDNNGVVSIAELACYALVCRKCEEPHCVAACPSDALEQQPEMDKLLVRHNMRCVSCKTCSHACPYGTIYPENVPLMIHICDFCLDRRESADEPLCVETCPYNALKLQTGSQEPSDDDFLVGDNLLVHSTHWTHEKA